MDWKKKSNKNESARKRNCGNDQDVNQSDIYKATNFTLARRIEPISMNKYIKEIYLSSLKWVWSIFFVFYVLFDSDLLTRLLSEWWNLQTCWEYGNLYLSAWLHGTKMWKNTTYCFFVCLLVLLPISPLNFDLQLKICEKFKARCAWNDSGAIAVRKARLWILSKPKFLQACWILLD